MRRARRLPRQFRELVVPAQLAHRRPHAVHHHAPERAWRFAAGAGAVRAAQGGQAAADRHALSRHRSDPHLPASTRTTRASLRNSTCRCAARRPRSTTIDFSNASSTPRPTIASSASARCTTAAPASIYPDADEDLPVSGKFMFEPRLANYPFDTQRFAIDIQPKSRRTPVHRPAAAGRLRDKDVGHGRLGSEGAVRRLRRGLRADDRCLDLAARASCRSTRRASCG